MSFFKQFRSIISKASTTDAEPQVSAKPDEHRAEPIERRSHKRLNSHKGRRVLIIDDSPTIVAVMKKTLRSAGCITMEALDAEQGLEIVRQEKPDLVFLDIVLPGMNGFAALRLMRRDPSTQHIPVIMISGNEQATEQFYARRIGADDFMKKPFSRFEVFGRIDSLVELNKLPAIRPAETTARAASSHSADHSGESIAPASAVTIPQATPRLPESTMAKPATPLASSTSVPRPTVAPAGAPASTAGSAPVRTPTSMPTPPASVQPAASQMTSHAPAQQSSVRPGQPSHPTQHQGTGIAAATAPKPVSPIAVSPPSITPLEARSQLTAMGLQYFNQEQFMAALQRNDKLAIELFIAGGGVDINV